MKLTNLLKYNKVSKIYVCAGARNADPRAALPRGLPGQGLPPGDHGRQPRAHLPSARGLDDRPTGDRRAPA